MLNKSLDNLFTPFDIAQELEALGFNDVCLGVFFTSDGEFWEFTDISHFDILDEIYDFGKEFTLKAPTYQQAIDWLQEEHDIYIGRTGYNDRKTPKRWVYHVDDYYVQDQSFDGAIRYAIFLVKKK